MQKLNTIICGDNLPLLQQMITKVDLVNEVDLVYLDPPLEIGLDNKYSGEDKSSANKLIKMLRPRILIIRELLKESGSLYYHCDWRIAAYVQVLLDEIFGRTNLIAKIIWQRNNRVSLLQRFVPHTYDVILIYGKSSSVKYFPQYMPYSDSEIDMQYKYIEEGTGKRYRLVNLTSLDVNPSKFNYEFLGVTRNWRFPKKKMEEEFKQGRIIQKNPGSVPMLKKYVNEGKLIGDIWTDINVLSAVTKENTGYPTQKPSALLQRILEISTEKGDLVLDPFCGSGTTLAAAEKLGRKWIGIDISPTACDIAAKRIALQRGGIDSSQILQFQDRRTFKEISNLPAYEFENWLISALKEKLKGDLPYAKSKGLEMWMEKDVYSITTGSQPDYGFDFSIRSIPVMVKQKEKIRVNEISNFAIQLIHHKQTKGIFIAQSFLKSAQVEAKRKQKDGLDIILISAKELIQE